MGSKKIPPVKHDAPNMKGPRARNDDGELRQVRGDKLVSTIEAEYDVDLGVRGDMRLDTLRERLGVTDMKDILASAKLNSKE
jgi:hypothetical protein